jgi:hypothetical protein
MIPKASTAECLDTNPGDIAGTIMLGILLKFPPDKTGKQII